MAGPLLNDGVNAVLTAPAPVEEAPKPKTRSRAKAVPAAETEPVLLDSLPDDEPKADPADGEGPAGAGAGDETPEEN